jgi:hypothetical protein
MFHPESCFQDQILNQVQDDNLYFLIFKARLLVFVFWVLFRRRRMSTAQQFVTTTKWFETTPQEFAPLA